MPATRTQIGIFLDSTEWTAGEKFVIRWQFSLLGEFYSALANAIKLADENNLSLLAMGFPNEVGGFLLWNRGTLGKRLRDAGLEI